MTDSKARHSPRDFLLRAESIVSSGSAEKAQQPLDISTDSVTAAWNPHSNRKCTYNLRLALRVIIVGSLLPKSNYSKRKPQSVVFSRNLRNLVQGLRKQSSMFYKAFKALLIVSFTTEAAASAIKNVRLDFTNSGVPFDRRMESSAPSIGGPVSIP